MILSFIKRLGWDGLTLTLSYVYGVAVIAHHPHQVWSVYLSNYKIWGDKEFLSFISEKNEMRVAT